MAPNKDYLRQREIEIWVKIERHHAFLRGIRQRLRQRAQRPRLQNCTIPESPWRRTAAVWQEAFRILRNVINFKRARTVATAAK
jgi:hypothetical protein